MAPSNSSEPKKIRLGLKQSRISFGASKRTSSIASSGGSKSKVVAGSSPAKVIILSSDDHVDYQDDKTSVSSISDDEEAILPVVIPRKRKILEKPKSPPIDVDTQREDLAVLEMSGRLKRVYNIAKEKMGSIPPIHSEGQTKVHHILRVFDNMEEYGPCVGVTRLERWERANALGLQPPLEVRDILLTKQGVENDEVKHNVFYGEVV